MGDLRQTLFGGRTTMFGGRRLASAALMFGGNPPALAALMFGGGWRPAAGFGGRRRRNADGSPVVVPFYLATSQVLCLWH